MSTTSSSRTPPPFGGRPQQYDPFVVYPPHSASGYPTPPPSSPNHQQLLSPGQQALLSIGQQQQLPPEIPPQNPNRARPISVQPTPSPTSPSFGQHPQQQSYPAASSQIPTAVSRKRQSHNPSSKPNNSPPHVVGPDASIHPTVALYQQAHPRRALVHFGPYILLQTLGEGEFGKVKLGVHVEYGEEVAVKLIRRGNLDSEVRMSKVEREIEVLKAVKHPNIVRLFDVIETEKYIGIILEFANGGELFDHILAHRYLKEKDAQKLFAQLISGVHYLHQKHIVHRDLKLENLLLDKHRNVIITDFGFANKFAHDKDDLMATSCGSPCYAAPELVISEGLYVGSAVDIWSCGVILYAMLSGYLPFDDDPQNPDGDNINLLYRYIINTRLQFPDYISGEARDLLNRMLIPDPVERCTLEEIMSHSWLRNYSSLFDRSVEDLEEIAQKEQQHKRLASRREMQARLRAQRGEAPPALSRGGSTRPGTAGYLGAGSEVARVKQQRHQSALPSTTMIPHFGDGSATSEISGLLAPPTTDLAPQATSAPLPKSQLDNADPFAMDTQRMSWTDASDSTKGGDSRSSIDHASLVIAAPAPVAVPSSKRPSGSTRQRHTIQIEYDQSTSSSPASTNPSLVSSSPKPSAEPFAAVTTAFPLQVNNTNFSRPSESPSIGGSSPSLTQEDVDMSSPSFSNEFQHNVSGLPTPAPSSVRPSTPKQENVSLPDVNTPRATVVQPHAPVSPPETPKGTIVSSIPPPITTQPLRSSPAPAPLPPSKGPSAAAVQKSKSRNRISMDKFGLGRLMTGNSSTTSVLNNISNSNDQGIPPSASSSKVSVIDADATKQEKKSRRNTLGLVGDAFKSSSSRALKTNATNSVIIESTSAKRARERQEAQNKRRSRVDSVLSMAPSASVNTSPAVPSFGINTPSLDNNGRPGTAASGSFRSDTSSASNDGAAQKVMNFFRRKSQKRDSTAMPPIPAEQTRSSIPLAVSRKSQNVVPPQPTTVAPSPTVVVSIPSSVPPSSFRAAAPKTTRAAADALAMPPPKAPTPSPAAQVAAGTPSQFSETRLRYHNGAMNKEALSSRPPPVVLDELVAILMEMGIDAKHDSEFKLKCIRTKRRPSAGAGIGLGLTNSVSGSSMTGFSLMGNASAHNTDKRGLPLPTSPSGNLLSSSLKGIMRRGSSYGGANSRAASPTTNPDVVQSPIDIGSPSLSVNGGENVNPNFTKTLSPDDSGDEVRFSVEITRLKNLPGLYSVDFKRLKGPLWTYAQIYKSAISTCKLE